MAEGRLALEKAMRPGVEGRVNKSGDEAKVPGSKCYDGGIGVLRGTKGIM